MRTDRARLALTLIVAALAAGLAPPQKDAATTQKLGGPSRALTYLSTDKPIYKAGETVFLRGVVLDAVSRKPVAVGHVPQVEIKGPKGELAAQGQSALLDGAFGFSWVVPEGSAGGEYSVFVRYPWSGLAPATRKFDVRVYRAPRLKSQIVFARDGYGPADQVSATLEATRAEGGAPAGAKVTAVARVDEVEVARVSARLDEKGRCTVGFKLPAAIERGEGSLSFTIEDGGVVETAAKTLPILMQAVDVALYPEGGDLVAGLGARVYLEARTPSKKPADIAGEVVDGAGKVVATFRTEHEGRGRFAFTPAARSSYALRITEPAGIKKQVPLPRVATEGAALEALEDTVGAGGKVRVKVAWTGDRVVKVTLARREQVLDSQTVDAGKQKGATLVLDPKDADGVLVVTVAEKDDTPLAERLVFRAPARSISVQLLPDRARYAPGAPVSLTVKTTLAGKPVPAFVGLTVTDDSVLELVEKREQAPALPAMVLLEADVQELADAHVYLDPKNPKAKVAVDRLLGTQGWRRFAFFSFSPFLAQHQDAARRIFALVEQVHLPRGGMRKGGGGDEGAVFGAVEEEGAPLPPMQKPVPRPASARPPPAGPPPAAAPPKAPPPPAQPVAANVPPAPGFQPPAEKQAARLQAGAGERKMKRELAADELWAADEEDMPARRRARPHLVVREFAHQVRPDRRPDDRLDFAETLYWHAGLRTNAQGEAKVSFGMSDAVTAFKVSAGAYSADGVLGEGSVKLESVRPFYVEPKLPLEVTSGDLVRLPVAFVNGTSEKLAGASLALETKADVKLATPAPLDVGADARVRRVVELAIGTASRPADLKLTARAAAYSDIVTRQLNVKAKGFPTQLAFGGQLKPNGTVTHTLVIPPDLVLGSLTSQTAVFPSPSGNLTRSLEAMVQEPSGCFEQTSSTTYPMTMALQYFQSHSGVDPKLVADAQDKLDRGYKRLTGYECKGKGYEWFGEDPGHEALTAYGLLHFSDMAKVRSVDQAMVANTRAWLLKQRDGKGGFERKRRALHVWVEDKDVSDAYITWALLESGEKSLPAEVARVAELAKTTPNSNALALAANVLLQAGDQAAAAGAMEKLAARQDPKAGVVGGSTGSIVGSSGDALHIETTALATLAWLRSPAFAMNVEAAMKYLSGSCKGGRYGSTQSTVLALRAIVAYDRAKAKGNKPGTVTLFVDGKRAGTPAKFDASTQGALELTDIAELLGPGTHQVELKLEGGSPVPYSLAARFHRTQPDSSKEAKVALEVSLNKSKLVEGDVVEATARVTNTSDAALSTVVAIVGLPGGLEPRHDQLKELVKQKAIDAYEVLGRDVVFYWRGMTPKEQRRVPLSLVAAVPGRYTGPASRAYLYYGDEHKAWVAGLAADIAAKN